MKLTPMYMRLWNQINIQIRSMYRVDRAIPVGNRIGVLVPPESLGTALAWMHVCHPRILNKALKRDRSKGEQIYVINRYTQLNTRSLSCCRSCGYELSKKERAALTLHRLSRRIS